jgi:5'-AMP-activated protein kinase catalytic alpha subunit
MLTQKHVAIKTIDKTSVALNDRAKKKIENEIEILRIASASRHMVRLLEVFENENYVFFVMEYAKKGDLLNYMKSYGVMPEFRAKNIFFDIILGLEFLHSKNVIHRDIKLDNILLSDKFRAKIADFGISKINPPENSLHEQCGTPAYLAPEIIKNNGYSGFGTDIWSLGILLHTLLLGKVPFKAETLDELYEIIVTQKLAIPEKPYITEECKDILQKMLDKNPATRISIE